MILRDNNGRIDVGALAQAWDRDAPTFAVLPARFDMPEGWVEGALAALPVGLAHGHFLLATSGSTGAPKLLVASRARAADMARVIGAHQGPAETAIITLPLSYCFAFVNQWVLAYQADMTITQAGFDDPAALTLALRKSPQSRVCLVGAQVQLLAGLGVEAYPNVTSVAFAGGPFPWGQAATLARFFPNATFTNNYGCAEAMPRLVVRDVTEAVRCGIPPEPGHLGQPLPGITFRMGEEDELQFHSPYAALGYVTPEGYAPFDPEGWIGTGDVVRLDDTGNWHLLGRRGEVFKRHGEKVSLARLRATVDAVWDQPYALAPATDRAGEAGVDLILEGAVDRVAARTILMAIREAHPRAHWPLHIVRVDRLPQLGNGKIDLAAMTALHSQWDNVLWDQRA